MLYKDPSGEWVQKDVTIKGLTQKVLNIHNVIIDNDKLLLIFNTKEKHFVTHSTDGITWETAIEITEIKNDNTIKIIHWPATDAEVQENLNMNFYFCIHDREIKVVVGDKTVLTTCYSSFDQGISWQTLSLEAQNVNVNTKTVTQSFYYDGFVHVVTVLKDHVTRELYRCYSIVNNKFQCKVRDYSIYINTEIFVVKAFFVVRDYLFVTIKYGKKRNVAVSYDGENFVAIGNELPHAYGYEIIELMENSWVMLYRSWTNNKFYVTPLNGVQQRIYGCAVANTVEEMKDLFYSRRFIHNAQMKNICNIYTVPMTVNRKTCKMKTFYIKVPADSLAEDCFTNLYWNDNLIHKQKVPIPILFNTKKESRNHIFKFQIPHFLHMFMYNELSTKCSTKDNTYVVEVHFNDIHKTFDLGPNSTDTEYNVNALDFVTVPQNCIFNIEGDNTQEWPKGTNYIKLNDDILFYQLPEYIPEKMVVTYSRYCGNVKTNITVNFLPSGKQMNYIGLDFVDVSINYNRKVENITSDRKLYVVVADFTDETILGMICPDSDVTNNVCFFDMYQNDSPVQFQDVFQRNEAYSFPNRYLYNGSEKAGRESLLKLNKSYIERLNSENRVVSFACKCQVNEAANVTVNYFIAPSLTETQAVNQHLKSIPVDDLVLSDAEVLEDIRKNSSKGNTQSSSSSRRRAKANGIIHSYHYFFIILNVYLYWFNRY